MQTANPDWRLFRGGGNSGGSLPCFTNGTEDVDHLFLNDKLIAKTANRLSVTAVDAFHNFDQLIAFFVS